jgi:hypothetical protein
MGTWVKDVFVEHPDTGPSWPTYDNRFAAPNPCGFGSARLATLAFAPPHPQGLGGSSQKAIYRKVLTPASKDVNFIFATFGIVCSEWILD